ncbi:MAG: GreA/GreB family elongation factor [Fimbriimonadaceae bacterium]
MIDSHLHSDSDGEVLLTPEGFDALTQELEDLTVRKRAEIADRIRESQQHGEFSEDNSELDEVKFEQAIVENRIAELKAIFAGAVRMDPEQVPTSEVGYGSYVVLTDLDRNQKSEYRLVAGIEADTDRGFISDESPLGQAIFGAKKGDTVEFQAPRGMKRYRIESISRTPKK